jgi:hypothetical protein
MCVYSALSAGAVSPPGDSRARPSKALEGGLDYKAITETITTEI